MAQVPRVLRPLLTATPRWPSLRLAHPACAGSGGALPGLALLLSTRNRRIYVMRLVTGGLRLVLHPRPAHPASYPLPCTVGPCLRFRLPLRSPRGDTVAFRYPSSLPNWDGTCLSSPGFPLASPPCGGLTVFGSSVRSRAHPQAAGPARHTTTPRNVLLTLAGSQTLKANVLRQKER